MVFSAATLEAYPASYITALYVKAEDDNKVIQLMRQFPSVTIIDLDASLAQVRDVMDKASLAVQAVFLFTLFAGLAVLWAAVQSSLDERSFESAILRTLGASRGRVLSGVVVEFLAIGMLAGLLASTGASLAAWHLAVNVYELQYHFSLTLWFAGPVLGMILVGISGLIATWRVVTHSPVSVLRGV
jgi:putative ABC transport system permease protein